MRVYLDEVEAYFKANRIADDRKATVLLSSIGSPTFMKLTDLLAPHSPTSKTYKQITDALLKHCEPRRIEIAERYTFYERRQEAGESIAEYAAVKHRLATHCKFGAYLPQALRDAFVFGIRDQKLRQQLLGIDELTYKKASDMALAGEAAAKKSKEMHAGRGTTPPAAVQRVHRQGLPGHRGTPPHNQQSKECYRCGGKHKAPECRFKDAVCHFCKKPGHLARVCRSKAKQKSPSGEKKAHWTDAYDSSSNIDIYNVQRVRSGTKPYIVNISINDAPLRMEIDTGAAVSLISKATCDSLWDTPPTLVPTNTRLRTYSGQPLVVLGTLEATVKYEAQQVVHLILVVEGAGPNLLGRDLLSVLKLDWSALAVQYTGRHPPLTEVLKKHDNVFRSKLGKAKHITATLHLEEGATPKFCNARPVPYAIREKIERELERLQRDGIIEPTQFSDWAAPVVPVTKADGSLRLCGDYKLTINKAAKLDSYPLPKIEDLFAKLAGGKRFTKLDVAHAYQQIPLSEESKPYVTINTHKGLFQHNRLPFGVHSAPAIFQRAMESLLRDVPSTVVYLDDILISGKDEQEHLCNLDTVLERLEKEGLTLKKTKCHFMLDRIEYLGHTISAEELQPAAGKTKAIWEAPAPQNVSQLRSFLGMANYYARFIRHLSSRLAPLYALLQKTTQWKWGAKEAAAFTWVKKQLVKSPLLQHYDPTRSISLSTDASPYGVGAVLSHVDEDGTERPVAYASRTLTDAEKRYSQLDKEALAIIYGVKRFHHYLYGRKFAIASDHKPLQYLLSEACTSSTCHGVSQTSALGTASWSVPVHHHVPTRRKTCER